MVEIIGDVVMPSQIVVPQTTSADKHAISGALFMSGVKLTFYNGTTHKEIAET